MKDDFTERIHIKTLLTPSENNEGIMDVEIISIDDERVIQQNPAKHQFTIYKGTTFNCAIVYKYKSSGTPVDLTGYEIEGTMFLINTEEGKEPVEYDLHPVIVNDPDDPGKINITLSPEETEAIEIGTGCSALYHYHINIITDTGFKYRFLMGKIKVCK
mgnify:CR=1 FL=1